jgi:hypothetical protein
LAACLFALLFLLVWILPFVSWESVEADSCLVNYLLIGSLPAHFSPLYGAAAGHLAAPAGAA